MANKTVKVVVDAVLSFVFFIVVAILINWLAGLIFGTDSKGNADVNGHVLLLITVVITLVFAVLFYRYIHLGRRSEVKDVEGQQR